jgi:peptidoglycan/LPS O-acetylase OafA/YrhL
MEYRREIDGLRAIAVLPVILFHAGVELFSGGFVGVDVFFVISGYLITSIILKEQQTGTFSLVRFYERRARRILPALFLIVIACIPFAWAWLLPEDLKSFGKSLIAVPTFTSNILFARESDYFTPLAELKPLLHTWSLAVEEQFYVFFPILLILAHKWRAVSDGVLIAAIGIISLGLAQWGLSTNPKIAFYFLPTRAWELMIGALIAVYVLRPNAKKVASNELLGALGLVLILVSVFAFTEATPFPGLYALVPTIGTGLIILFAQADTLVGRLLATRAFVGLGLISYSAYLWHHPLFAFARHRSLDPPSLDLMMGLAALSIFLAYISWRYVERPFRDKKKFSQRQIFILSGAASATLILAGVILSSNDGFASRSATDNMAFSDFDRMLAPNHGLSPACDHQFTLTDECTTSPSPKMILWGDSYGMHLGPALKSSETNIPFRQHTMSSCIPVTGLSIVGNVVSPSRAERCLAQGTDVLDWLATQDTIEYVVLASPFTYIKFDLLTADGDVITQDKEKIALDHLKATVKLIRANGQKPIFVAPPPNTGADIGRCFTRALLFAADPQRCDFSSDQMSADSQQAYRLMSQLSEHAPFVSLKNLICSNEGSTETCEVSIDGLPLYRDDGHLSITGSAYIGKTNDLTGLIATTADAFWAGK